MSIHDDPGSYQVVRVDHLTVVLRNVRTSVTRVAGRPVLQRSFVVGDEWDRVVTNLASALHDCGEVDVRYIGDGIDPWGTSSDDPDAMRHSQSAAVIVTFEGDRLDELRTAVQQALHLSGMASCWFLPTGSDVSEVVRSRDHTVHDIAGLLHAEGCDTPAELDEHLDDQTEQTGWIDWEESDEHGLTVCVGEQGVALPSPFTVGELWDVVAALDEGRDAGDAGDD